MSFGLPQSTEINKIIPKRAIIEKFALSGKERTRFDSSIHRLIITNELSPRTLNIQSGEIRSIFVLRAELREEDIDARVLSMLFGLIDQRMIIILQCGIRCRPTVFNDVLIEGDWMLQSELSLKLNGLDLDEIWRNLVIQIGRIEIEEGYNLSDQILKNEERRKTEALIAQLRDRMMKEKQPRKKKELFERIRKLEGSIRRCFATGPPSIRGIYG